MFFFKFVVECFSMLAIFSEKDHGQLTLLLPFSSSVAAARPTEFMQYEGKYWLKSRGV